MSRASRKLEHLRLSVESVQKDSKSFNDVQFVHQALPEVSLDKVSISTTIGELALSSPIIINAMTGGARETEKINEQLAIVAKETGLAMAVGSQMSALKDKQYRSTYEIARKINKNGMIFANIGAEATLEQAYQAIEMLDADALQIHINAVQELIMPEGDRDFEGVLEKIRRIKEKLQIPLIIKEVGFGISRETAESLKQIGISIIDVGGKGGTNFATIENKRRFRSLDFFENWGITTPASILETQSVIGLDIIAAGGIHNSLDIAKAIGLGANAVGIAGAIIRRLINGNIDKTVEYIYHLHEDLSYIMTALGALNIEDLQKKPLVVSRDLKDWCDIRGIDITHLARR